MVQEQVTVNCQSVSSSAILHGKRAGDSHVSSSAILHGTRAGDSQLSECFCISHSAWYKSRRRSTVRVFLHQPFCWLRNEGLLTVRPQSGLFCITGTMKFCTLEASGTTKLYLNTREVLLTLSAYSTIRLPTCRLLSKCFCTTHTQ